MKTESVRTGFEPGPRIPLPANLPVNFHRMNIENSGVEPSSSSVSLFTPWSVVPGSQTQSPHSMSLSLSPLTCLVGVSGAAYLGWFLFRYYRHRRNIFLFRIRQLFSRLSSRCTGSLFKSKMAVSDLIHGVSSQLQLSLDQIAESELLQDVKLSVTKITEKVEEAVEDCCRGNLNYCSFSSETKIRVRLPTKAQAPLPPIKVTLRECPRGYLTPSITPFPLKLETFMRVAGIPYEVAFSSTKDENEKEQEQIDNDVKKSPLSWMIIGDEELRESFDCIPKLCKVFNVDLSANAKKSRIIASRLVEVVLENHIYWGIALWRWVYNEGRTLSHVQPLSLSPSPLERIFLDEISSCVGRAAWYHGFGRLSPEQVTKQILQDLEDLSVALGKNDYFLGDSPGEADCAAFAMLAQFLWNMPTSPFETAIWSYQNLVDFVLRMRDNYWPDWESLLQVRGQEKETLGSLSITLSTSTILPGIEFLDTVSHEVIETKLKMAVQLESKTLEPNSNNEPTGTANTYTTENSDLNYKSKLEFLDDLNNNNSIDNNINILKEEKIIAEENPGKGQGEGEYLNAPIYPRRSDKSISCSIANTYSSFYPMPVVYSDAKYYTTGDTSRVGLNYPVPQGQDEGQPLSPILPRSASTSRPKGILKSQNNTNMNSLNSVHLPVIRGRSDARQIYIPSNKAGYESEQDLNSYARQGSHTINTIYGRNENYLHSSFQEPVLHLPYWKQGLPTSMANQRPSQEFYQQQQQQCSYSRLSFQSSTAVIPKLRGEFSQMPLHMSEHDQQQYLQPLPGYYYSQHPTPLNSNYRISTQSIKSVRF